MSAIAHSRPCSVFFRQRWKPLCRRICSIIRRAPAIAGSGFAPGTRYCADRERCPMPNLLLVIGNKAYSSCLLRPWLLMKQAGIAFEELRLSLYGKDAKQTVLMYSPTGRVPVLKDGATTIWDSLAICEYLAEKHPRMQLWPAD